MIVLAISCIHKKGGGRCKEETPGPPGSGKAEDTPNTGIVGIGGGTQVGNSGAQVGNSEKKAHESITEVLASKPNIRRPR